MFGPLAFVAPPNSFTRFHQDGNGTVDSVHYCHRGCNEVVILRRLDEQSQRKAITTLLKGIGKDENLDDDVRRILYSKPHEIGNVSSIIVFKKN